MQAKAMELATALIATLAHWCLLEPRLVKGDGEGWNRLLLKRVVVMGVVPIIINPIIPTTVCQLIELTKNALDSFDFSISFFRNSKVFRDFLIAFCKM